MLHKLAGIVAAFRISLRTPLRRAAAVGAAVAAITLSAVITASQGPDLNILLYPLPESNYDPLLRISGLAEPGQELKIQVNQKTVAVTRANESGDFVARITPAAGTNQIQVVGDNGRFKQSLSGVYRVRQVQVKRPVAQGRRVAAKQSFDEKPPAAPGGGFSILSASTPTVTAPPATSSSNPITLSGSAQASSTVSFYVNGKFTRSVVATAGGTFSTWVPLEDGLNSIYATATDASGESPASNTVQVTYTNAIPRTYAAATITQNTVWTAGSAPIYTLSGTITIASGATLWIQPGVTVKFSGYHGFIAQGGFVVRGTSAARAEFRPTTTACTATSSSRYDWFGVEVAGAGNADIQYGDFHCADNAVYFNASTGSVKHSRFFGNDTAVWTRGGGTAPLITAQNEIRNSTHGVNVGLSSHPMVVGENLITANQYGIYVYSDTNSNSNPAPVVNNNSIYGNTSFDYLAAGFGTPESVVLNARSNWWGTTDPAAISLKIRDRKTSGYNAPYVDFGGFLGSPGGAPVLTGSTLLGPVTQNTTLAAGDYLLLSDLMVNPGVTLTLSPGVSIMSVPGARVLVNGNLQAVGNSSQRVRFGSVKAYPSKGDWNGVQVEGAGATANLDYVRVEHATSGVFFNGGQGTVARSLIRFCTYGVNVQAKSNPTIHQGTQVSHNDYGIYVRGDAVLANNPMPVVNGNSLFANAIHNYNNATFGAPEPTLDATGNWWGVATSAGIAATIGLPATSSVPVNYNGFLSAEPVPQAMLMTGVSMSVQHVKPLITTAPAAGTFTINRAGSVNFRAVRDADGAVVRSWTQSYAAPGQYSFAWNGLNDQGAAPAGGLYHMVLIATDGLDPYTYDVPLTTNAIGAPTPSDTYNPYLNDFFKFSYTFPSPSLVSLLVTPQAGAPFYPIQDAFYPAGTHWLYWDGRGPDGALLTTPVETFASDGFYLRSTGVYVFTPAVTIAGTGAAPNIEVKSDPTLITHSYDQASRIVYRIDADAVVRVTVLPFGVADPNHPSAIVLVDNVSQSARDGNGNPIDHVAEWRGFNAAAPNDILVSTDGAYTFAIEATLPANGQKTLYRGILNLTQ
jgi:FlgD Ig-like domain